MLAKSYLEGAWLRSDDLIKSREGAGERGGGRGRAREGCDIVLIAAIKRILSGAETKSCRRPQHLSSE